LGALLIALVIGSLTTSAFAHDESLTITFNDLSPYEYQNYDQPPYKGNLTLTVTNNTGVAWGDFHFYIFDFDGYSSQAVFVDSSSGANDPIKTPGSLDSWSIYNSGKNLDLFFYSNPVNAGDTVTFHVSTDNTGNQQPFGIGFYPSVVPEPVSSVLFMIGGGMLGIRIWRKQNSSTSTS